MKKTFLALAAIALLVVSCNKEDDGDDKTCKTTRVHQVLFAPTFGLIRGARTLLFSIELRGSELTP